MSQVVMAVHPSTVLAWMVDEGYCIEVVNISTQAGQTLTDYDLSGAMLIYSSGTWKFAKVADEASIDGVVIPNRPTKLTQAASTVSTEKYPVLVRGPARVKKAGLPANDPAAAAFTSATVIASLKTLDIIVQETTALTQS